MAARWTAIGAGTLAALMTPGSAAVPGQAPAAQAPDAPALWQVFQAPPDDARPLMRWWWFGPAVTTEEISREIAAMQAGGFGGFEVQPTYPLMPDSPRAGVRNLPYLSPDFLRALRHAADTARARGMRIDVTLGSGWPFGGPHISADDAAAGVKRQMLPLPAGAATLRLPSPGPGGATLAAFMDGRRLPLRDGDMLRLAPADRSRQVALFQMVRTGQGVKRAAVGAEGYVLDHLSMRAVARHLDAVGTPLMSAFAGTAPPHALFSDSLESYGAGWTDTLPAEFRRRRGYDIIDHLPALFDGGEAAEAVRFDWARTLAELVDENYLRPITLWARARGTRFRAQVYGTPPPLLSSNAIVDLPEGEGADWRAMTSTRWATSAAHLYDRPVVSAEVWTWLRSPAWAATPLDMKVEADRHFLQGVNQIVGHGWPYSPPSQPAPGWAFYAAAALNDRNPWYPVMPAVTRYLHRVSALLRQGRPAAQVALYLPTEDAMARLRPDKASVNDALREGLGSDITGQILDAGHQFDAIDAAAIRAGRLRHRVLVIPAAVRIDPDAYRAIADWVAGGGAIVSTGPLPSRGGGLLDGAEATRRVADISRRLAADPSGRVRIVAPAQTRATLARLLPPVVAFAHPDRHLGFVRRALPGGSLYFVVNTGPTPVATTARFAGDDGRGTWWDAMHGTATPAGTGDIAVRLAPYESRFLVFGTPPAALARDGNAAVAPVFDLSTGWQARAGDVAAPPPGRSWTEAPALRHHSGEVRYSRSLRLPAGALAGGRRLWLDFGGDRPLPEPPEHRPAAAIEAPVRDAATIRVNGRDAGALWAPPWRVEITPFLRPGRNRIEVVVMNSALNAASAAGPRNYRLLEMRYGKRFDDQDTDKIVPRASGLLGRVTIVGEEAGRRP